MAKTSVVIPCYDEADRLPTTVFAEYLESDPETDLLFVDDGSRDGTLRLLQQMAEQHPGRIHVAALPENRGKAEAVRHGVLQALDQGHDYVGYFDADLSTPLNEIGRLRTVLEEDSGIEIVLGSRVQLLGRRIKRSAFRHYVGRFFATAAAWSLDLAVYDTQCGAKLFRSGEQTRALFAEPFITNWTFDVELIARRISAERKNPRADIRSILYELPLDEWQGVSGSKVRPLDLPRALLGLWRIRRHYLSQSARR
ncbi:MAG: glycosyltransferase [Myxococcota bacterium]|nr:glycosyltransferase [Myxococcota bacterium]